MELRGLAQGNFFVITPFGSLNDTHTLREKVFFENLKLPQTLRLHGH